MDIGYNYYRTIVISDLHLGTKNSMSKEIISFLEKCRFQTLVLNGDIIDGWRMKRKMTWKHKHTKFFIYILSILKHVDVVYIRGNHDDFLDEIEPFDFEKLKIVKEYKINGLNGKEYYICHGDRFDHITTNIKYLSIFGDILYSIIVNGNKPFNYIRKIFGLNYLSLSYVAKKLFKKVYLDKSDYYNRIVKFTKKQNCDGIILGHSHIPENNIIDNIHHLNSGDLTESGTLLVENYSGVWEILKIDKIF